MRTKLTEIDLNAYVDGQLSPEQEAHVEFLLEDHPDDDASVRAMAEQKRLLRDALAALPAEEGSLRTADLERRLADRLARRERAVPVDWFRKAAAVVLLVGSGWGGHMAYSGMRHPIPEYVAEAAGAHLVFAESPVRPDGVDPTHPVQLASWLSSQLGQSIRIPSLEALSIDFVGGRLLGTKEGPLAHLVYEDHGGHRLTLTIAPHRYEGNTRLMLGERDGVSLGYWSDASLSYAVVAKTSDAQIGAIASEIASSGRSGGERDDPFAE
ncbi:anti-sigma factor (plasmid) [Skermanella mucosa]|uniref:anti-sigma factor family protein n=1 Tax=Skermanella mucosa TaxID=1789672 RepID=UPI00192B702B|nr:anti-sigma factor [Skermanella mucosa]UEM25296.1 anti-sigma factor [Skermanella mucosa]